MLRDAAVAVIADRLGQRTGLENRVISELQLAQIREEEKPELPWFLLKNSTGLATVANQQTLGMPADFLMEYEDGAFWIEDTDGERTFLVKGDYGTFSVDECLIDADNPVRRPTNYSLVFNTVYFFPTPTAVYPLQLTYYGADALLTTNIANAWLSWAPELLISSAGIAMARFLRD